MSDLLPHGIPMLARSVRLSKNSRCSPKLVTPQKIDPMLHPVKAWGLRFIGPLRWGYIGIMEKTMESTI